MAAPVEAGGNLLTSCVNCSNDLLYKQDLAKAILSHLALFVVR